MNNFYANRPLLNRNSFIVIYVYTHFYFVFRLERFILSFVQNFLCIIFHSEFFAFHFSFRILHVSFFIPKFLYCFHLIVKTKNQKHFFSCWVHFEIEKPTFMRLWLNETCKKNDASNQFIELKSVNNQRVDAPFWKFHSKLILSVDSINRMTNRKWMCAWHMNARTHTHTYTQTLGAQFFLSNSFRLIRDTRWKM